MNDPIQADKKTLFTIGHADHSMDSLLRLLIKAQIQTVVDVRSVAYAESHPLFNQINLQSTLKHCEIEYKCLEETMSGEMHSDDFLNEPGMDYTISDNRPCLEVNRSMILSKASIWLEPRVRSVRIALLCGEESPALCRRRLIALSVQGINLRHIRGNGRIQTEDEVNCEQQTELTLIQNQDPVVIYSIGCTSQRAERFFRTLREEGIKKLMDIRLNNWSQLAGFAKRDDLSYFLRELCGIDYVHELLLAPTRDILDAYKKDRGTWQEYERAFLALLSEREVEKSLSPDIFNTPTVMLCYEPTADFCHRRLVLEYLQQKWGNVEARHL